MTKTTKRGRPRLNSAKREVKSLSMDPSTWKRLKGFKSTSKAKSLGLANEDLINTHPRLSDRHPLT